VFGGAGEAVIFGTMARVWMLLMVVVWPLRIVSVKGPGLSETYADEEMWFE
jgi:hypothetical protein